MYRIWQWAWDRYKTRYSWVIAAVLFCVALPIYLALAFTVLIIESSDQYRAAITVVVVGTAVGSYVTVLPGVGEIRLVERWAAGRQPDSVKALEATYTWARRSASLWLVRNLVCVVTFSVPVAMVAGASGWRLVQYAILGGALGAGSWLQAAHGFAEAAMRPARVALAGTTGSGDALPRGRPTFAAWASAAMLASIFAFTLTGAISATAVDRIRQAPALTVVIAVFWTVTYAVPLTVMVMFAPSLQPIRDLAEGTERVAAGDYTQRLPVVQDDDLGALAASFNRMQAGLAERQRLQAAFGSYVDPGLAARLLEQGDDVFTGERREVTVMFVDVRDFTAFAEANTAEDTVARLNQLFEIVVPAVVGAGGHVNKFLGDGALAIFGAPNDLPDHADAAVRAAVLIHRRVAKRFGGEVRIGVGINTGVVIAGTIGGAGHLEFTLIGDTTNVAARVEQLTKTTGDAILVTGRTVDALVSRPPGLIDRGSHALKGKSAAVQVFGLDPGTPSTS